jgi:hypothetical protein
MKLENEKFTPYSEASFATVPGPATRFFRRFWLWQIWRFIVLNLKIMRIVIGGHS